MFTFRRLRVHKKFREIRPDLVPKRMRQNEQVTIRVPLEDVVEKLPELRVNLNLNINHPAKVLISGKSFQTTHL